MSEASNQAHYRYAEKHLKRVPLDLQKDFYEQELKKAAERAGESVNGYIKKAIEERIRRES